MADVIQAASNELEAKDHLAYMKTDFAFHELLYQASGNPWISKIISNARLIINILRNISMGDDEEQFVNAAKQSMKDHKDILNALIAGDASHAHLLMEQHLANRFVENIIEKLED